MRRCEKGSLAGDPFVCIRCGLGMQIRHCFRALCGASERGGQGGGCSLRRFAAEVKADALSL